MHALIDWSFKLIVQLGSSRIQNLNPSFGPKLILNVPSTPPPPTQSFLPEGSVLGS
jgi:hypothetical protein